MPCTLLCSGAKELCRGVVGLREGEIVQWLVRLSEGPQPALGAPGATSLDLGPGTVLMQLVEVFHISCASVMGRDSGSPGLLVEALAVSSDTS